MPRTKKPNFGAVSHLTFTAPDLTDDGKGGAVTQNLATVKSIIATEQIPALIEVLKAALPAKD